MKKDLIEISNMNDLKKKDSFTLQQEAIQLKRASNLSIVELGKRLIVLKEQCLKHSEYMKFIQEQLKIKYSIANAYVKLVKSYGISEDNANVQLVESLGVKKASRLLKIVDLQERLAFIKDNDLINKSYLEIDDILNKAYPTEVKTLNGYSLYTNIHRSLKSSLEALAGSKNIIKANKEFQNEAKQIEKELNQLISKIEKLKSRLGKEEKEIEKEKVN